MKLFLCLLITLVVTICSTFAQSIPQGANAIELTTEMSDSTLFESVQGFLENEGFTIGTADETAGTVITDYKVERGAVTIRVLASIENSIVTFTGQGSFGAKDVTYKDIELMNDGLTNGPVRLGFITLSGVVSRYAQTLSQATMEYIAP
jgi:hypothetical protein